MMELHPGLRLLDRYELRRRLGAGGTAEVWLAHDHRAGSAVALRLLSDALCGDPAQRERFEAGWRRIRSLNHPHIVRIFEFHAEPRPFYGMEYIDGSDIAAFADRPPSEWLRGIASVAAALVYAHNRHLPHGDVTARNVLVDSGGRTVLSDFAASGSAGGTPAALSPERGADGPPSAADDIHALGVLVFELWHGRAPDEPGPRWPSRDDFEVAGLRELTDDMLGEAQARPDAETVVDALGSLGISAGLLPRQQARARAVRPSAVRPLEDEPTEVVAPRRRAAAAPAAAPARRQGVPATIVGGALVLLLAAAIWVVAFLPERIEERRTVGEQESAALESARTAAEAQEEGEDAGEEEAVRFSENLADDAARDEVVQARNRADRALGELLTKLEVLELRGVERWGGEDYAAARAAYEQGDDAYLAKDYGRAEILYREASAGLDGLIARVDGEFERALAAGRAALEAEDVATARRQFELALAITPDNEAAERGLARAETLLEVIDLADEAEALERRGELNAAAERFRAAVDLDPYYDRASAGLERVRAALERRRFEERMTAGFEALQAERFDAARQAFEAAREMRPSSQEPRDGLLQVEQAVRLRTIERLTAEAERQEAAEDWQAALATWGAILEQDANLDFAREGRVRARRRLALDRQLEDWIANPDQLSEPATLRRASTVLTELAKMDGGPRLVSQRRELARLLKRAATPLEVEFVSDGQTEVTVFRVGRLGTFERRELELRPGTYTVMGSRVGYRDVRIDFRVAPEIELEPIVVRCEEPI
ncbi:protein kinase domain-containing protein [Lentisalinibacter salinarum]|uniref:protein kinase domain-containing protein n=1 Tax=Lentisalinibacter salinarum TaxID=2992239 RepID=UPI0038633177